MGVERIADVNFPTKYGIFRLYAFKDGQGGEHLALVNGKCDGTTMVRVHSKCVTGDIFSSMRCDCRAQLEQALELIGKEKNGVLIYLDQEGRGIGLSNKIRAYELQDGGMDTVDANLELGFAEDLRDYESAAEILKILGLKTIKLITNNPKKVNAMKEYGIEVAERIPLEIKSNRYNEKYLKTKKERLGHILE